MKSKILIGCLIVFALLVLLAFFILAVIGGSHHRL